ncbi:MAG TPA: lycopene beta-cyclase CrtY [Sphingomicrobium sp.]|nr:lycopene beta-cyclase CrtY [Sphingomicrobium sp.]
MTSIIICGGGLAGGLAAIAITKRRPELDLLLIEQDESFGGNHIWSFFDSDIAAGSGWIVDQVARRRWPDHEVRFPRRERRIPVGYTSIRSTDLDCAVRSALGNRQYRLGANVTEVRPGHVIVDGKRIEAGCVIDARGPGPMTGIELGWQKFVGRVYRFPALHQVTRPVVMDATVPQLDGYRFIYMLPLGQTELLIEDTYYSSSPLLDQERIGTRLDAVARQQQGGDEAEIISQETGVLPVVIEGRLEDLWPKADAVPRLGLRGGFFHPTTGYSLPDAAANAMALAEQGDLSAFAVALMLRARAQRLWTKRRFFQLLNRMLFRAAEPDERYRVLEHFYRLPPAVIQRFYAAELTQLDKLRILSGRPPVGVVRALSALRSAR